MNDSTTYETLNKAADLIRERGWAQVQGWADDSVATDRSPLCLEGAIQAATGLKRHYYDPVTLVDSHPLQECPAYVAVQEYLGTRDVLWLWNDDPATTGEQVIEVLRAAAVVVSARENTTQPVNAAVAQDA